MKTFGQKAEELKKDIADMLMESNGRITAAIADARCDLWFCEAQPQNERID